MKLAKTPRDEPPPLPPTVDRPDRQSALILLRIQNDFFSGGAMPIPESDHVLPLINDYIALFRQQGAVVVATRDWHPPNHCSFQEYGGSHPAHCVQGSRGAQIHSDLHFPTGSLIISASTRPNSQASSCFDGTSLGDHLEDMATQTMYLAGLSGSTFLKQTVLDACHRGLRVILLTDVLCVTEPDSKRPFLPDNELAAAGAVSLTFDELATPNPP